MTRAEELAFRFADGVLSDPEWAELERLSADPAAGRLAVGLLELEAALRGERRVLEVWRVVVARLLRRTG